jgi:hypothetical protein
LEGNYHFCQNGALRTTIGINRNGGFARVCSVPLEQVAVLPANVTFEQGLQPNHSMAYICFLFKISKSKSQKKIKFEIAKKLKI